MRIRVCQVLLWGWLFVTSNTIAAQAKDPLLSLQPAEITTLMQLPRDGALVKLPQAKTRSGEALVLHSIRLMAGSQKLADDPQARLQDRQFLIGWQGEHSIALAFEADGRYAFGFVNDANGLQQLVARAERKDGRLLLDAVAIERTPIDCANDQLGQAQSPQPLVPTAPSTEIAKTAEGGAPGHEAVIGIEVDFPMMNGQFGNSPATALNWLQQMFLAANVFYQRDLALKLVMATPVIYNTATDPYCTPGDPCSPLAELLFQFSANWRNNYSGSSGVDRDFAVLVSGRKSDGFPTGASWTNQYCDSGHDVNLGSLGIQTAGSYGINIFVPASATSGAEAAELFGHELGHQLGAEHDNCTDGDSVTAGLQPIGQCSNAPNSMLQACWGGALACPVGGAGLIMSTGCPSVAGCSNNRAREFHPVQIGILSANIAAHSGSCLAATTLDDPDVLFYDGFE